MAPSDRVSAAANRFFKGCHADCSRRFEFRCYLGRGAYGEVW